MFSNLKEAYLKEDGKVILYHDVLTSPGQSGAPIILKLENFYQIIGVHTGWEKGYNLGTLIKSISFESLKKIFSSDDDQDNIFDKFMIDLLFKCVVLTLVMVTFKILI